MYLPPEPECQLMKTTLGERVRQARERAGYTQTALARRVGTGQTSIANLEGGRNQRSSRYLFRIAEVCGVSPRWLAEGEGEPEATAGPAIEDARLLAAWRKLAPSRKRSVLMDLERWAAEADEIVAERGALTIGKVSDNDERKKVPTPSVKYTDGIHDGLVNNGDVNSPPARPSNVQRLKRGGSA